MRETTEKAAALRAYFERRLVILERDGGLSSTEAATEAARLTGCYARQRSYSWDSLREAFRDYHKLLGELPPDRRGAVDLLPFGLPTVHVVGSGQVIHQGLWSQ